MVSQVFCTTCASLDSSHEMGFDCLFAFPIYLAVRDNTVNMDLLCPVPVNEDSEV